MYTMKLPKHLIFSFFSVGLLIFLNACGQVKQDDTPWIAMFDGTL